MNHSENKNAHNSKEHRIVITGFGAVGSTGSDIDEMWDAVKKGESGIDRIEQWDVTGWEYPLGAELKDYNPRKMIADRKLLKVLSRPDVIGLNAVKQAVEQSQITTFRDALTDEADIKRFNDRTGVYTASSGIKFNQQYDLLPLFSEAKRDIKKYAEKLFDVIHPMWLLRVLSNNVLAYTGIQYNFKGANQNIANHGISGTQAIGEAMRMIRVGDIDRAVVVAYEATVEPQAQIYYGGIGVLSNDGLRPFNQDRNGTILAEGAGAMIIETLDSARARGATIYGELIAEGFAAEAKGVLPISPEGEGVESAIQSALQHAALKPSDIGMVIAHANGSIVSDESEAKAITRVFGKNSLPVTGFKWSIGHSIAAAGVLETILTLLALREGIAPGIANLTERDQHCSDINISSDHQAITSPFALCMTRGFASMNACLILKNWEE